MGDSLSFLDNLLDTLKQWIVLKARADWLVKLRISCAIYLPAIQEKMASRFASVTTEGIIQIIFFGVYYLTVLVYTKIRDSVNIHH